MGNWETSGVTDVSSLFGRLTWILDVQAHSVTSAEASAMQGLAGDATLVQGGQLLLLMKGLAQPRDWATRVNRRGLVSPPVAFSA